MDVQPRDLEILDLEAADHRSSDRQPADRQSTDGPGANSRRADRGRADPDRCQEHRRRLLAPATTKLHRTVRASSAVHAMSSCVDSWCGFLALPPARPHWSCHPDDIHRRPGFFDPAENREDRDLRLEFEGDPAVAAMADGLCASPAALRVFRMLGKTVV